LITVTAVVAVGLKDECFQSLAWLGRPAERGERRAMRTPYVILGVPRSASEETIKAAFHRAAKACHPDLNAGDPAAERKLTEVVAAYDILKSPERRAAYALQLRNHHRAVARRVAAAAAAGLASGSVVTLVVWLSGSPSHKQVVSAPAALPATLAVQWKRVEASSDAKAIRAFVVMNPDAPEFVHAGSRLTAIIETVDDASSLNVFRPVASHTVAQRARERLAQLGGLVAKEDGSVSSVPLHAVARAATDMIGREHLAAQEPERATTKVAVREEPAVQTPQAVTAKVVVRQQPASPKVKDEAETTFGREEPAARKLSRLQGTVVRRLAGGHDPMRSETAENRSSALFGVGF
jgi:curved DNA-binding protein CbpA